MGMRCGLRGSESYCEFGKGICCRSCERAAACEKACLNDPGRCGYRTEIPAGYVPPERRVWKGSVKRADTDQAT